MIHLVIGRQGSGKTLVVVQKAIEAYAEGKTVYSNVHLNFPYKKLNYQDIIHCRLHNAVVILDEIHLLLSARKFQSKTSVKMCDGFFSMVRKKELDIYATTQTLRKVDVRVRDEIDFLYICEKFAYIDNAWVRTMHNKNLSLDIPIMIKLKIKEDISGRWINQFFYGNHLFSMFDSKQIIKIEGLET